MTRLRIVFITLVCTFSTSASAKSPIFFGDHAPSQRVAADGPLVEGLRPSTQGGGEGAADTLGFGFVDEEGFAVAGEVWTFDHETGDPLEGWGFREYGQVDRSFLRHITDMIWTNGDPENGNVPTGNAVDAPILSGLGSAWAGAYQNEADDLCWGAGLGYGNFWCQRLVGPIIDHPDESAVEISFTYFNDTELDYDYTRVIVRTLPSGREIEILEETGQVGLAPDHPTSPPTGISYETSFGEFSGDTQFQLIFEIASDGGWSDEDAQFSTEYGPFAVDDIVVDGLGPLGEGSMLWDFESGLGGWMATRCSGGETEGGIAAVSNYTVEDPCQCELEGNVMEFHDEFLEHPWQHTVARTPPVDVATDVVGQLSGNGQLEILADWWQYSLLPQTVYDNVVHYRAGWEYYPYFCPVTGEPRWSDRVGAQQFLTTGDVPVCQKLRSIGTDEGVPADVEQVRFVYEVYVGCFGVCAAKSTETNFTPLIDNVQIRFTLTPEAPPVAFGAGTRFTDGFSQSLLLDPNVPGNADVVCRAGGANSQRLVNGDSLYVQGPVPTAGTEYDTRLWFRVARKGPGSNTAGYDAWRERVQRNGSLDGIDGATDIEAGEFATAKMDTFNVGVNPSPFRYHSYFIEEDARFDGGAGEKGEGNEIIADGVLLPGTSVEYFVSSNYTATPDQFFLLPDTVGGFFSEFEILPRWRDEGGVSKFSCLLYVDAFNGGAQPLLEEAFAVLGLEVDRYDYLDAASSWKLPLARGNDANATNGTTLWQLLGYRGILLNTGSLTGSTLLSEEDFTLFSDWLTATTCGTDRPIRSLHLNGDGIGSTLSSIAPSFLHGELGASLQGEAYSEFGPEPDQGYCVPVDAPSVGSAAYGTVHSQEDYAYDAWGNWCPEVRQFDVLGPIGSGVGNRVYVNGQSGEETQYAQVVNDASGGAGYRSVVDGVSWHHLVEHGSTSDCEVGSEQIVSAAANEIRSALEWAFGVGQIPSSCEAVICEPSDVQSTEFVEGVTRLFQNAPNPFRPSTTLRFSLSSPGPAALLVYDVKGRRVRTLVDGELQAGLHNVVWDGTDDDGKHVPTGVYWSQLTAAGFDMNKKMVRLQDGR